MSKFYANFLQEVNRFFCLRNMIIFLCLAILVLYSTHLGVMDHNVSIEQEKEFQKTAELSFNKLLDYYWYSVYGFDILSLPAASGVLFANTTALSNLAANINTIVNLRIYNDCQSKAIFNANALFQYRLSTILFLLGSLLAIFLNVEFLREQEYLKFLASASSEESVFTSIIVSRFLLLLLSYFSILVLSLGMMAIKGIPLTHRDFIGLLGFLISASIMLLFFFLLGTVFGSIRKPFFAVAALLVIWIALVLLVPGMFDSVIDEKANAISSYYKVYNDKLSIVSNFEKQASKRGLIYGKTSMDVLRKEVKSYLNNEYKAIEAIEEKFKEEIRQMIKFSNQLYNLLPTTFYLSTACEASSRGHQNFLDFYSYLQKLRRQFVEFWIDRVYFNDPKVMVNFVKKDENVFKAKSAVPFYFTQGVVINLGYCIVLFFLSFFLYKKALFPAPKKAHVLKGLSFNILPGMFTEIKLYKEQFMAYFLDVFFGRIKRITCEFILWGENIVTKVKKDFMYLPRKESIPGDISVKSFLNLFKRLLKPTEETFQKLTAGLDKKFLKKTFADIEGTDKALLLLTVAQMKKSPVLILDNIADGIPEEGLNKIKEIVQYLRYYDDITIFNFSNDVSFLVADPDSWQSLRYENGKYFDLNRKQNGK